MGVEHMKRATRAKNDEFYTRYEDIEKEVVNYKEQLKGLWIYCPCDDYRWSNFWKYFYDNFNELGLKRLTATNYDIGEGAFRADYDGFNVEVVPLDGNGDFRSQECTKIKDECDIIITNFPFSIWRDAIYWLDGGEFRKEGEKIVRIPK